ncbi:damage-inducible protein CinA, partial [bacterium]|nr:damage-inducible protein CinA [bacterium]
MSEPQDIHAEIIAIGDELLLGQIVNGNAATLGRALTGVGAPVQWSSMVADDTSEIQAALALAVHRSKIIILTGGLGPTPDDITKAAVA